MKLTMKLNLNLNRAKVTKTANRHEITTNKRKNAEKYPIEADFVKERVKFSFLNSCGNFSHLAEALMTQKNDVELTQRA